MAPSSPCSATFHIASHDLGQCFEIRWFFTATAWRAVVHPMDGGSRQCGGSMEDAFGEAFAAVFDLFGAGHLVPVSGQSGE